MYPEIKLVKFLKNTERNDKGFGEMDIDNKKIAFYNILFDIIIPINPFKYFLIQVLPPIFFKYFTYFII